jgi:hypothetical protein
VNDGNAAALAFLGADKLRNIHLLKMLAVYPAHARLFDACEGDERVVLVRLPVAVAGYDREHYPNARWIGVIGAGRADLARDAIARALAAFDHVAGRWVFKCMDDAAVYAIQGLGAVARMTSFVSYTGGTATQSVPIPAVHSATTPTPAFLDLLAGSGGYRREEFYARPTVNLPV